MPTSFDNILSLDRKLPPGAFSATSIPGPDNFHRRFHIRMNTLLSLLSSILVAAIIPNNTLRASSVLPPTFADLVQQSQTILVGDVQLLRSRWVGEGDERHIATFVTLKIVTLLKGESQGDYELQVFGGTVGDTTMEVADSPRFRVGERMLLFIRNNAKQVIPLVGAEYGLYRITSNSSGEETVNKSTGETLSTVHDIDPPCERKNAPSRTPGSPKSQLTLSAMKTAIRERLDLRPK